MPLKEVYGVERSDGKITSGKHEGTCTSGDSDFAKRTKKKGTALAVPVKT
jgi:hypothetical protein